MATENKEIQKRYFTDLSEVSDANDTDILVLQDAVSTRRITFLNLFNKIKTKLNLKDVATSGLLADLTGDANNRVVTDKEKTKWNGYDQSIKELNADLGGLSVATREISNLHVDGVVYPGTTEITFMRFQASTSNRVLCIGFINASTNADIWGKYINTNKIVIQKGTDGVWSNFTTI